MKEWKDLSDNEIKEAYAKGWNNIPKNYVWEDDLKACQEVIKAFKEKNNGNQE